MVSVTACHRIGPGSRPSTGKLFFFSQSFRIQNEIQELKVEILLALSAHRLFNEQRTIAVLSIDFPLNN